MCWTDCWKNKILPTDMERLREGKEQRTFGKMNYHILTLFPEMVSEGLNTSILGKAATKGHITMEAVNIRDYTLDKHKKVDDYPYGGGAGMLMQAQPVYDAWKAVAERIREKKEGQTDEKILSRPRTIYLTPQGKVFTQKLAEEFAQEEDLIFLCGHYEGIDERVLEEIVTDYVSIGDYVLTGGELPSMVMIDAISRLVPGVLKNEESAEFESFHDNLLEYPQYTRPEVWQGKEVPAVLLSGDHSKVDKWRLEQSEQRTLQRRPDLYEIYARTKNATEYLLKDKLSHMDMLEAIRHGNAQIIQSDESGVLLWDQKEQCWRISADSIDMGERLLSRIPAGDSHALCVHQAFLAESVERRQGRKRGEERVLLVYTKKILPDVESEFPEEYHWIRETLERREVPYLYSAKEDTEKEAHYRSIGLKKGRSGNWWIPALF